MPREAINWDSIDQLVHGGVTMPGALSPTQLAINRECNARVGIALPRDGMEDIPVSVVVLDGNYYTRQANGDWIQASAAGGIFVAAPEETSPYIQPTSQSQLNLLCNSIVSEFSDGMDVNRVAFPIRNGNGEVEVVTCERSGVLNNWRYRQIPRFNRDEVAEMREPRAQRCTHCGSTNLRTFKYDGADMIFCRQCRTPRKDTSKNLEV